MARILFVHDDEDFALVCTAMLEALGHVVRSIHGTGRALAEAQRFGADLIVLDDRLGGLSNGVDLTRLLRRKLRLHTPIVVISPSTAEATVAAAMQAGVSQLIAKPFIANELVAAIDRLLHVDASRSV